MGKKNKLKWTLLLLVLAFQACNQKESTTPTTKEVLTSEVPSSFLDFYQKFHSNPEFQMQQIIFPLDGHVVDEETQQRMAIKWEKDSWTLHHTFDDHGGTFQREFVNFDDIIIEKISDRSGKFNMERRFSPLNGSWHLIYYSQFKMDE